MDYNIFAFGIQPFIIFFSQFSRSLAFLVLLWHDKRTRIRLEGASEK
jgi:hypothetical protein